MIALVAAFACAATPAMEDRPAPAPALAPGQAEARFAMGCFWCAESDFEHLPGVIDAVSGYTGGFADQPTYHQVGSGLTGHAEAIRVIYDPKVLTYEAVLDVFWHHIDPVDGGGQFCDRGTQYRPAIFPLDDAQKAAATASVTKVEATLGQTVAARIEDGGTFWVAEAYHQNFWKTNADHYARYRLGCGRDARVAAVWGGPSHGGAR